MIIERNGWENDKTIRNKKIFKTRKKEPHYAIKIKFFNIKKRHAIAYAAINGRFTKIYAFVFLFP